MPKCHEMSWNDKMPALWVRVLHQNIFFKRLWFWNQRSYIGEMHLKMTTRARAFFLLKNRRNDLKRLGHPTFIRLSKIRFHNPSFDTVVWQINREIERLHNYCRAPPQIWPRSPWEFHLNFKSTSFSAWSSFATWSKLARGSTWPSKAPQPRAKHSIGQMLQNLKFTEALWRRWYWDPPRENWKR